MRHPILSALLLAFSLTVSAQSSLDLMSQARLRQMRMMQREAETPNSVKLKSLEVMKQKLGVPANHAMAMYVSATVQAQKSWRPQVLM